MRIPSLKLSIALVLAVAGVGAAVAVAAPTRKAGPSPNAQAILQAIQKTANVTSGHFSVTAHVTGGGASKSGFSLSATGGFDTKSQSAEFTLDLGALASLLGGASGGASIPSTIGGVATKGALYLHLPSIANQVKSGAEWLKFDSSSIPASATQGVSPATLSKINPQKALAQLTASISVHKVGSTTVRGASTTHYRVTVNAAKAIAILPKAQQAAELKVLKAQKLTTVPVDVYIDGSGYVRRVSVSLSHLKVSTGAAPAGITFQVDLYDFGTPVHVTAPPASKTADGSQLVTEILRGIGG